jgi:SAM-dependent methyltransferase
VKSAPPPAEFDAYAPDYDAGMSDPLKRLLGADADQYLAVKVRWLRKDLSDFEPRPALLDFGCGEGAFLRLWAAGGDTGPLHGCDVSQGMIEEARRRWSPGHSPPDLRLIAGAHVPFAEGSMAVVVACAVFHHIPPPDRPAAFREMLRVLRPGGRAYVFEHNPLNPLTVLVVNRTPIDRNAILLRAQASVAGLHEAGAVGARVRYIHFTPPRLRALAIVDSLLARCPLGAGYVVRAEKPADASASRLARPPA